MQEFSEEIILLHKEERLGELRDKLVVLQNLLGSFSENVADLEAEYEHQKMVVDALESACINHIKKGGVQAKLAHAVTLVIDYEIIKLVNGLSEFLEEGEYSLTVERAKEIQKKREFISAKLRLRNLETTINLGITLLSFDKMEMKTIMQ